MFIHVTLVPYIYGSGELKSKPPQHSVKELLSLGIQPNAIVCRSERVIPEDVREKIALFCNVRPQDVIQNLTADVLYEVPLMLEKEGLADSVCDHLGMENKEPDLKEWIAMVERCKHTTENVTIALVGKYVELHDAYLSVAEALCHAGIINGVGVDIRWVSSEDVTPETVDSLLEGCDGMIVPGGFGDRGISGMIEAIRYARLGKIPFFGICLGMQMGIIEYARNVLGFEDADSGEFNPECRQPVIDIMPEQKDVTEKGGTMRLGLYPCKLVDNSLCKSIYNQEELIYERHRHRFEFNNEYRKDFQNAGIRLAGLSPDEKLVEMIELPEHPWFVGVQFHPEFKSRPNRPHPLFASFVGAAKEFANGKA